MPSHLASSTHRYSHEVHMNHTHHYTHCLCVCGWGLAQCNLALPHSTLYTCCLQWNCHDTCSLHSLGLAQLGRITGNSMTVEGFTLSAWPPLKFNLTLPVLYPQRQPRGAHEIWITPTTICTVCMYACAACLVVYIGIGIRPDLLAWPTCVSLSVCTYACAQRLWISEIPPGMYSETIEYTIAIACSRLCSGNIDHIN